MLISFTWPRAICKMTVCQITWKFDSGMIQSQHYFSAWPTINQRWMDSWASKFGMLAFVSIFFNLMCSIPEAVAQPAPTTSLVRQVLWSHVVQPLEDPIRWSTQVQYEVENQEAFELLVGLTMSFRESSSKLQDMIDSTVVGAALRLAFWFREDEMMQMNEHRRYPFSCSGALRALLESVNWWEIRTQFNEGMRCRGIQFLFTLQIRQTYISSRKI